MNFLFQYIKFHWLFFTSRAICHIKWKPHIQELMELILKRCFAIPRISYPVWYKKNKNLKYSALYLRISAYHFRNYSSTNSSTTLPQSKPLSCEKTSNTYINTSFSSFTVSSILRTEARRSPSGKDTILFSFNRKASIKA